MKLRQCYIKDDLCYIPLQNGKEAFTNKEYLELVKNYNWRDNKSCIIADIHKKRISLRKLIAPEVNKHSNFINNNFFDCRKENIKLTIRQCYIKDNICYIPLQDGMLAFCDADRFDEVNKSTWCHIRGYVIASIHSKNIFLHRFLYPEWKIIDHINHNPLDNTSKNLREVTRQQNSMNTKINCKNKSGYKGVYYAKNCKKYAAAITINQKTLHLGTFKTKEEAALAYNEKAKELFGEYAFLNVIS